MKGVAGVVFSAEGVERGGFPLFLVSSFCAVPFTSSFSLSSLSMLLCIQEKMRFDRCCQPYPFPYMRGNTVQWWVLSCDVYSVLCS